MNTKQILFSLIIASGLALLIPSAAGADVIRVSNTSAFAGSNTSSVKGSSKSSSNRSSICKFNKRTVSRSLVRDNFRYGILHKPSTKPSSGDRLTSSQTVNYLYSAWRSFGYSPVQAKRNARLNLRQARLESGLRPNAVQLVLGTNKAGGLFQMIPQVFNKWSVSGFNNRFRPLDNSLAVVNAQINARQILNEGGRILSGKSGWTAAGGRNACK